MIENGSRVPGTKGHVYYWDGFRYPSVTTIIHSVEDEAPELTRWKKTYRSKEFCSADEYTRYSQMRGIFVHHVILSNFSPFPLDPGELPPLDSWRMWSSKMIEDIRKAQLLWNQLDIEILSPIYIETPLCHHGKWYAGQPDLRAMVKYNGKKCNMLIDLKTSKRTYDSHAIQIGAYAQMITTPKIEMGLLIYLDPSATVPRVVDFELCDIQENIEIFNDMRDEFYNIPNVIDDYGLVVPHV